MSDNKKILLENTIWLYMAKLIVQALGMLASILVLRKLEVNVYGTYVLLFGLFAIFQLLVTSPLKHVFLRFIPGLKEKSASGAIGKLLRIAVGIALLLVVIMLVSVLAFQVQLAAFFNIPDFGSHLYFFILFVLFYSLRHLAEVVLMALLLHKKMAVLNVLITLFRSTAYIILLKRLDVNWLLSIDACLSLIYVLVVLLFIVMSLRSLKREPDVRPQLGLQRRIRRFWLYSILTELGAGMIGRTSDTYIVAALSNPYSVGIYGFSVKIYEMCYKLLPIREFESVVKPVFFKKYDDNASDEVLNRVYNYTVKVLLPLFILPFLYFLLFGSDFIYHLFGDKYAEAYWVTTLILLGLLTNGVFYPLIMLIQLKERLQIVLLSRVVVVLSLILGVGLMKSMGVVGVALATVIGELVKNLFMFWLFRRGCIIRYDLKIFSRYGLLILLALMLFFPMSYIAQGLAMWMIKSTLFIIYFGWFIIRFHPLNIKETELFVKTMRSNVSVARIWDRMVGLTREFRGKRI
ncbi:MULTISPECIES: lipopolysaccharide biosynthesis protein [unclassified Carboxylicivirga]|uniref:lipopolysaccharide biosynthesis protein n=1 Tax=Carboxylicivirga TaxID=1628153 RepID=UPI003D359337